MAWGKLGFRNVSKVWETWKKRNVKVNEIKDDAKDNVELIKQLSRERFGSIEDVTRYSYSSPKRPGTCD